MTKEENIATLNEHLTHWKRLLYEKICDQSEGEKTIDALQNAIKALEQEQCEDCISREAVENVIKYAEINFTVNSDIDFTKHKREVQEIVNGIVDAQIKALRDLPSVTPQPEVGQWIYDKNIDNWRCSECGEIPKTPGYCGSANFMVEHFKYCNHCGTKMGEVEE